MSAAWATSAEVHGPVELTVNGHGQLCAHVQPGSPNEAKQGWSVQLWQGNRVTDSTPPSWQIDVAASGTRASPPWPDSASRCAPVPPTQLAPGRPYLIEISSIRLYRSHFCWQAARPGEQARILAMDRTTGQCSPRAWDGALVGHSLTSDSWWSAWHRWWLALWRR